jgi:ribosomal protein S18 acetylase RimI-like enzyme
VARRAWRAGRAAPDVGRGCGGHRAPASSCSCSVPAIKVRPVRAHEDEEAGRLLLAAYRALPSNHLAGDYAGDYAAELADVARRSSEAEVLVAVRHSEPGPDEVVGCVTFVPDASSPWADLLEAGEAGMWMLAVRPAAQGRGIGRALVDACVARARALGRAAPKLHTTPWMTAAQHLYEGAGFVRFPSRDWSPLPEVPPRAYWLEVDPARAPVGREGSNPPPSGQ